MARYPYEEFTTVVVVPSVADLTAPTTTEIAAGTDITCFLTKDGLTPNVSTSEIDAGTLCNRLEAKTPGSVSASPTLKGYRDNEVDGDTFWDLVVWSDPAVIVVRRGVQYGTSFANGQAVEVYKGQWGEPQIGNSAANADTTFEAMLMSNEFEQKATVASGS